MGAGEADKGRTPSLNPLAVGGTQMPPNLLLVTKLVAVCFLISGQWAQLPEPFLPFLDVFDEIGSPALFEVALKGVFLAGAALLLTNRFPRAASLILGLVLVVAMLASRNYWENNRFFVCLLFLLAGVSDRRNGARIVQLQIALLYFAAGLNKLLDVDWRSGQYFENLASYAGVGAYGRISDLLPGLLLSATLAWSVIVAEFALSVAFVLRRFVALAIWVGVGYHTSLVLITGRTFGMFWYAATASYIAFVALGPHHVQVSCGWREAACSRLRRAVERLDVEGMVGWRGRTGSGLRVTTETTTYQGFAGLVRLGTALPAVLFMIYVLAALPMLNHRVVAGLILASLTAFGLSVLRSSIEEADFRGKRVFSGRLLKRPGSG